jgi:excinuclease ABC subunit B
VKKEIADILERKLKETEEKADEIEKLKRSIPDKKRLIQEMEKLMFQYAESLEFEKAAFVRDQIEELKQKKENKEGSS